MLQNATKFTLKSGAVFFCEICDFKCSRKCDHDRHVLTLKHQNATKCYIKSGESGDNKMCPLCSKYFKHSSSMYRHKKTCEKMSNFQMSETTIKTNDNNNTTIDKIDNDILQNVVIDLVKQNQELIELMKNNMGSNNMIGSYNTINNSHNKTFNLQFFLNETCKDAMNIMDFVNSMEIDLDDLEKVGELGYVNGMTNIILKNLKALDITKRPLHCTDAKREIMYIKDDNKWEKETENKDKMKKALKYIVHKNAKMFNVFKAKYPDCIKSYSTRCDQYNKLVVEVLGGKGDNETQNNEKIIRRIAKEMTIDKSLLEF
jgi:hypothetical protein